MFRIIYLLPFSSESFVYLTIYEHQDTSKIHKIMILTVTLRGCEISSIILREEHKLRVFENRVRRGIFGPTRQKMAGGWRKVQDELHNLYSSPSSMRGHEKRIRKFNRKT